MELRSWSLLFRCFAAKDGGYGKRAELLTGQATCAQIGHYRMFELAQLNPTFYSKCLSNLGLYELANKIISEVSQSAS